MKHIFLLPFLALFATATMAQNLEGSSAEARVPGARSVRINPTTRGIEFVRYNTGEEVAISAFGDHVRNLLGVNNDYSLQPYKTEQDQLGFTHTRHHVLCKGIKMDKIVLVTHVRDGKVSSWNTNFSPLSAPQIPLMTKDAAREIAIAHMGSSLFKWEQPGEDQLLKEETGNPDATWFPGGELVYGFNYYGTAEGRMRLCWMFDIYSVKPLSRQEVYVDAENGQIIFTNEHITATDVPGTAVTMYSGTQSIVADSTAPGNFRLREAGRGNGIETKNMKEGTNKAASVDFIDTDNFWNNVNADRDEVATDAHWAAEMTYDLYLNFFGRNSYDGVGGKLRMYVHYDVNYSNAFWDGNSANFGDGPGGNSPFSTLDVTAHEISHGLTQETAGLIYSNESGALNESFSDVFGAAVEFIADPANADWLMGEDLAIGTIRDMENPGSLTNPDTYHGNFWYFGTGDNGGVHTNSGVQNKWYQLLVDGGSGTNDNGDAYNISGLGLDSATKIAFRNLNVYLMPSSDYADARYYAIQAAQDLYGDCSNAMIQTMNAWYAVGVGLPYSATLTADFRATDTIHCSNPATVAFTNESGGGLSFLWNFGDGGVSTLENPSHTYAFPGSYDVTLVATGCDGSKDTLVWNDLVKIDAAYPCVVDMPPATAGMVVNACEGVLRDAGGGENYPDNTIAQVTIAPPGAMSVRLEFSSFEYATGGDYVAIYDGPSTSSPTIGIFNGTALPMGGVITSTGSSITIYEKSNFYLNYAGFQLSWSCTVNREDAILDGRFTLFPNPTADVFQVNYSFTGQRNIDLQVLSATGQEVWRESSIAGGEFQRSVDVSQWAAGVYTLVIRDGDKFQVEKVVVQ